MIKYAFYYWEIFESNNCLKYIANQIIKDAFYVWDQSQPIPYPVKCVLLWSGIQVEDTLCQEFKVHHAKRPYGICKCNIPPANMDEHHQK